jgi:type I restriction enzyme S subunit
MSWEMVKLDDCLQLITYGFTNPMPDSEEGPWKVTAKDIVDGRIDFTTARHTTVAAFENDLTDKSRPIRDDLLLTKDGTLGRLAIVGDETICINQSVALLRLKKELLLPRYLLYLLQSPEYQGKMLADAGGSTIKHIYITKVNQLMIPVPPLEVQQKLIDILSAYDRMIDNCKEQIKLLEEAAQRLYKEWFVDLRFPGHETTPITDGLPEGWKRERLVDIVKVQYGYAFDGSLFNANGNGTPIVRIRNIPAGTTADYTTEDADPQYIVHNGDILVGMDGEFHINSWSGPDAYLVQRTCSFRPNNPNMKGYLLQAIYEPIKYFESTVVGATVAHLGKKHIDTIAVLTSPDELYVPFQQYFERRQLLLNQNRLLTEARDRLLPKLMNGEIEV